jgi:hypothetical protein
MIKVGYHDHTVQLSSTQDPVTSKWSPKAIVTFVGLSETIMHPIQPPGVYETLAEADEAALEKAKAWIDQGKRR